MHQLTPLHSSPNTFPVIAIAIIGILSTALLLLCYYIFVIKCCLNWHRFDILNRFSSHQTTHPSSHFPSSHDLDPPNGLDESIIRLIPLIKFHKQSKPEPETYECAVCLSEFKDGERLRVIPICCHAFHIDCIDIWLQGNASCPLCRSGIDLNSIFLLNNNNNNYNNMSSRDQGFLVIEIQGNNNLDEDRLGCNVGEKKKNGKEMEQIKMGSIGDEWIDMRGKDEEFRVSQPVRRSISMDLSIDREILMEIRRCCCDTQEERNFCSSSKVRRCIFSFGYGGNCRGCSFENMN